MAGTWDGDWESRIRTFARDAGHDTVWSYVRANPGVSIVEIASRMDAAAVQLEGLVIAECTAARALPELVRDLLARGIRSEHPSGWAPGARLMFSLPMLTARLRDPYRTVARSIAKDLESAPPPTGWLPASGEDPVLRAACDRAIAALTDAQRDLLARGEQQRDPGDLCWSVLAPIRDALPLGDGEAFAKKLAALRPEHRYLYAIWWCDSEVRNGGFHQFYANPTGVVAPEAAEGFAAIGLARVAEIVRETMNVFGTPFPRRRADRLKRIPAMPGANRDKWDPFTAMDDAYYAALPHPALAIAADAYVARVLD